MTITSEDIQDCLDEMREVAALCKCECSGVRLCTTHSDPAIAAFEWRQCCSCGRVIAEVDCANGTAIVLNGMIH